MERSARSSKNQAAANKGSKAASGKKDNQTKDNQSLLRKFFVEELQDIYWAEKHLAKELPKLQKASTSEELADAFGDHQAATEEHVSRLEDVFKMMGETPKAKKCEAMEGLVKEAQHIIEETDEETATRDVALIMAAQKVEHYEIATYGSLVQLAKTIGMMEVAEVLAETLDEEKEADLLLTSIAEGSANEESSTEEGNDGEEE
ncbi:ferritin-like domain-containing protein [Niastella populi]|uniref:Rubrerythrin family protein n=1 Tax=Niastella populi TaxID=550983 RepID=A0A1V9FJD5_9BACT|nr:ferritin-like domain-containing protein [Niastella populi]OQP58440.1 rubrerythrin family protein [Niastella populi]